MRVINTETLVPVVEQLCKKACYELNDNVMNAFREALKTEESPIGKESLEILIENGEFAKENQLPCCHDTGAAVVVLEIGQEVAWEGAPLIEQLNEGVRRGYETGYLRKSIVADPLNRENTNDNTPAVIHTEIVPGDRVKITVMPKGGGSENMGAFKVLLPGEGVEGFKQFLMETVARVGGNPCPPYIIGIGIGGTMDLYRDWVEMPAFLMRSASMSRAFLSSSRSSEGTNPRIICWLLSMFSGVTFSRQ